MNRRERRYKPTRVEKETLETYRARAEEIDGEIEALERDILDKPGTLPIEVKAALRALRAGDSEKAKGILQHLLAEMDDA